MFFANFLVAKLLEERKNREIYLNNNGESCYTGMANNTK